MHLEVRKKHAGAFFAVRHGVLITMLFCAKDFPNLQLSLKKTCLICKVSLWLILVSFPTVQLLNGPGSVSAGKTPRLLRLNSAPMFILVSLSRIFLLSLIHLLKTVVATVQNVWMPARPVRLCKAGN